MNLEKAVFKIGGSILENLHSLNNTITQLNQISQKKLINHIIIIPGGGIYANFIRALDRELQIGNEMAHWMAIYAMDYNGKKIGKQYSFINLTDNLEMLRTNETKISLFLPLKHLRAYDRLPKSWDVTSDSIALYIAQELNLNQCFLIKNVDGIIDQHNEVIQTLTATKYARLKKAGKLAKIYSNENEIKKSKPIDEYTIEIINTSKISCILLNGAPNKSKIYNYFASTNESDKSYTKISFK